MTAIPRNTNWGTAAEKIEQLVDTALATAVIEANTYTDGRVEALTDISPATIDILQAFDGEVDLSDAVVKSLVDGSSAETRAAVEARSGRIHTHITPFLSESTGATYAKLRAFESFNDGVRPEYLISTTAPEGRDVHRVVELPGGKYAYPQVPMHLDYHLNPREYVSLVECIKSYVAVKNLFLWDPSRTPAITSTVNIHNAGGNMPITCSSFTGIVAAGIDYEDSLYAPGTTQNTRSRAWGLDFSRRYGLSAFQAHRHAQYFFENGMLYQVADDLSNVEYGDILFFSKQEPEGPGSEDYFLNVYHTAFYVSYGGQALLVHSKSASDPSGIMEDAASALPALMGQATYGARLGNKAITISRKLTNMTITGGVLTRTSAAGSLQHSIADGVAQITFNGATFEESVGSPAKILTAMPDEYIPDNAVLGTIMGIDASNNPYPVRASINTSGNLTLYCPQTLAAGSLFYGTVVYPTRVGHQALNAHLDPAPRA